MRSLVILVLITIAISCSKEDEVLETPPVELLSSEQILDSLTYAYNNNSRKNLASFLEYWNAELQPNNIEDIADKDAINVYLIFNKIYNPYTLGLTGKNPATDEVYEELQYVIIQNKVYFDFNFCNDAPDTKDSVIDFRPEIVFPELKTLFLTDEYSAAINSFLGNEFYEPAATEIFARSIPAEEPYKRMQFLNQLLEILPAQQGNYWLIETHPYISSIHFNKAKVKALVNYYAGYTFGEALFEKTNGEWQLVISAANDIK